jgi:hypothetical protein
MSSHHKPLQQSESTLQAAFTVVHCVLDELEDELDDELDDEVVVVGFGEEPAGQQTNGKSN